MSSVYVKVACGDSYVEGWKNFDYARQSSSVIQLNILDPLPLTDCDADAVYSSHFFEHIPIVSTTLGAKGTPVVYGEHILLANKPKGFANVIMGCLMMRSSRESWL